MPFVPVGTVVSVYRNSSQLLFLCVYVLWQGYVRFREDDGAKRAREGLLGKAVGGAGVAQLCGCDVELRVLEGMCEIHTHCGP